MSAQIRELVSVCEQLPQAKRVEVTDFARFLLARNEGVVAQGAVEKWLAGARGAAKTGVTTDRVMALTRGEP